MGSIPNSSEGPAGRDSNVARFVPHWQTLPNEQLRAVLAVPERGVGSSWDPRPLSVELPEGLACPEDPPCTDLLVDPASVLEDQERWPDHLCDPNFLITSTGLWATYRRWSEVAGERPESQKRFDGRIKERGYLNNRDSKTGRSMWSGLRLKDEWIIQPEGSLNLSSGGFAGRTEPCEGSEPKNDTSVRKNTSRVAMSKKVQKVRKVRKVQPRRISKVLRTSSKTTAGGPGEGHRGHSGSAPGVGRVARLLPRVLRGRRAPSALSSGALPQRVAPAGSRQRRWRGGLRPDRRRGCASHDSV